MPGAVDREGAGMFAESEEWLNNQEIPGEPSSLQKSCLSSVSVGAGTGSPMLRKGLLRPE